MRERLRIALTDRDSLLRLNRPKAGLLLLLGVVAALAGGFHLWRSQPVAEPLPPPPAAAPASGVASGQPVSASPPTSPSLPPSPRAATTAVTVHVAGKVREAGVFTLPGGSRVQDAVAAAGGPRKGVTTDSINLARVLVDGEQIVVGGPPGQAPALPLVPASGDPTAGTPVDLNTATVEQLDLLPGVGEVLARRIADYRTAHGGFRSVEQLQEVSGIGDRKYADIKDKVRV
ncbi:ComEA family DNA-binding protein [Spongiactinospora sp. TRM90649]|uniref:ComEA family DNA-binding protein n=1 Tax=Spongiactinospora sp. TRM90649 TaxID=3031114 RepID=UPI0023F9123C|nr:ComEA family DNA-binding protein [Spongiactinospora sp. TRM90649]MDF5754091.1 ComEA family DNA-binding protein [Spongiactinospora sp. TRM90649]